MLYNRCSKRNTNVTSKLADYKMNNLFNKIKRERDTVSINLCDVAEMLIN